MMTHLVLPCDIDFMEKGSSRVTVVPSLICEEIRGQYLSNINTNAEKTFAEFMKLMWSTTCINNSVLLVQLILYPHSSKATVSSLIKD